ncbi:MAG: efflux RND transporter periplasmic adaptor subunit [Opitutus sp.]|nr:efflux RND transporter periplasmic adaptor subunit [Opitutus sp.]
MPAKNGNISVVLKVVLTLAVVVGGVVVSLNSFRPTAIVATVRRDTAVDVVTGSVTVRADHDLQELKSELEGRVAWCDPLDPSHEFKKGDELLKLDSEDLQRAMKEAEDAYNTAVARAKIEQAKDPRRQLALDALKTAQRLRDKGEWSDEKVNEAKRALDSMETLLDLADFDTNQKKITFENNQAAAKRVLEKMTVRAPADGLVVVALVAPGALIGKGAVVATFYYTARLVMAKVSEDNFSKIQLGQLARVRLLNLGSKEFDAKVTKILPFADAETQRYTVYLDVKLELKDLIPNSTGEVTISVGEHPNQPMIPRRALGLGNYVLVVKDGRVEKRKVEVGYLGLNFAEVREKLAPGEQVIVEDLEDFRDGQRVRVTVSN